VENDWQTGTSSLLLIGDETGAEHAFSLRDIEGNSVRATGAGNVTNVAGNALYTVNGKSYSSASNHAIFGESADVSVSLLAPTDGAIRIEVIPNQETIIRQAKELVQQYNRLADVLRRHSADLAVDLLPSFQRILRTSRLQSEAIGIAVDSDGLLEMDEEKLSRKIGEDFAAVERAFSGSSGLATRLRSKAEQLIGMPPGTFASSAAGPYPASLLTSMFYHQSVRTGLFFNRVF
jgi:flagellar capping protein FliD